MHLYSIRTHLPLLAALLWLPAGSRAAEPLGRLFFSPEERAQIDRRQPQERPPLPPPSLNGIITRSAGHPTLFLDGQAVRADPRHIHMRDGTARVTGPDGRIHRLRVGDPPPEPGIR